MFLSFHRLRPTLIPASKSLRAFVSQPCLSRLLYLQPVTPVAVLYQQTPPPVIDGLLKPMKSGGYSDSGADIAYSLTTHGIDVITPTAHPGDRKQLDWVFPDTSNGIQHALDAGACTLWANTILFADHPLMKPEMDTLGVRLVGQDPAKMEEIDNKSITNTMLRENGITVAKSILVSLTEGEKDAVGLQQLTDNILEEAGIRMPCVLKPIRGRGSQGVKKVNSLDELKRVAGIFLREEYELEGTTFSMYGSRYMIEEYLPNEEITVTVMPPGMYTIEETLAEKEEY